MILLTYGGHFSEKDLVEYIRKTDRNYLIQGKQASSIFNHDQPHSLDFWLRQFAHNPNIQQADIKVLDALVETGLFCISDDLLCPDTGKRCMGIQLL